MDVVRERKTRTMKRIILAIAVMIITSISTFGQSKTVARESQKSPEDRTEKMIAKMKTDLSLTEDQVSKLKPLILKREQERKEMREKMDNAKDDVRRAMKESEEEIKKILTSEQYGKLQQMRQDMRDKHQHKGHEQGRTE